MVHFSFSILAGRIAVYSPLDRKDFAWLYNSLNDTHGNLPLRHLAYSCFSESGNVGVRFQERSPNLIGVELMTGVVRVNWIFSPPNDQTKCQVE